MVSYLQLAHNEWGSTAGSRVAHNFGRADRVDREAIARRLVRSL